MKNLTQQVLTPRHWKLYRLLMTDKNRWFTQKEICDQIDEYEYTDDTRNHCVEIGSDRIDINACPEIDEHIVVKSHRFKIANEQEFAKEYISHLTRLRGQKAQLDAMDMKLEREMQVKLFNNQLGELTEHHKQYHSLFETQKEIEEQDEEI